MSAAANAAGYLYVHDRLPMSSKPPEPKTAPLPDESASLTPPRTPRIEYRKRRFYPLPTGASRAHIRIGGLERVMGIEPT